MTMTIARQRNAFSEGLALGLLERGRLPLEFGKTDLDVAIEEAFQAWSYASQFPRIHTDLFGRASLDGLWVMLHVDTPRKARIIYWNPGTNPLSVTTVPQWAGRTASLDELARVLNPTIPADAWRELADKVPDTVRRLDLPLAQSARVRRESARCPQQANDSLTSQRQDRLDSRTRTPPPT